MAALRPNALKISSQMLSKLTSARKMSTVMDQTIKITFVDREVLKLSINLE